jgi:hypothetical protein
VSKPWIFENLGNFQAFKKKEVGIVSRHVNIKHVPIYLILTYLGTRMPLVI